MSIVGVEDTDFYEVAHAIPVVVDDYGIAVSGNPQWWQMRAAMWPNEQEGDK